MRTGRGSLLHCSFLFLMTAFKEKSENESVQLNFILSDICQNYCIFIVIPPYGHT